ncbi:efflux RND transporter periplasmic adaptor subunit [Deltaproteobacteria bacterium]|nr:efflux RND transporter periplasmic adaptor subunit [Deltaproteobacteria bacterium]
MEKRIRDWFLRSVFILACAGWFTCGHLTTSSAAQNDSSEEGEVRVSVVVTPSRVMTFEESIETFGNVESKNYALVSARIPGVIDDIYVEEGDQVIEGKTDLFQTDKIKADQAAEIARQAVSVADFTHRAKMATVAKNEADFEKARIDYERFKRLYEEDEAVTKNALESQESRFKQLEASLEEARANADLALRQMEQAQSRLIIAVKDLEDALVKAPITGHISTRYREPGEMAGAGTPVVRIDNLSILEISAFLPNQYYSRVLKDETEIRVVASGINVGELPVTYRSPTIDNRLRNFEVKALLADPPEGVVPGAMAKINVLLDRHDAMGVPRDAILKRSSGEIIFLAEGGKARMVQVETGLETDGWIEIISGDIRDGSAVIIMGQDQLNNGSLVSILREDEN